MRRGDPDPLLLQTVSERLARLLAETGSPRAGSDDLAAAPDPPPARAARVTPPAGAPDPPGAVPDLLVDDLPPPRRFQRAHLGVVVVLLLLGVLVAGWSLLRARPVAVASPAPVQVSVSVPAGSPVATPTVAASPATGTSGTPGVPASAAGVVVHVLGAVRHPGLVRLPATARVQDAVDAAGGFTRAADPGELNLAQVLTDGEQVVIGTREEPEGEVRGGGSTGSAAGDGSGGTAGGTGDVVDLNSADAVQLEELPGVGPVTAGKIVAWRDEHGRFSRVEELQEVDGIGPKTYAEIAPHVRV